MNFQKIIGMTNFFVCSECNTRVTAIAKGAHSSHWHCNLKRAIDYYPIDDFVRNVYEEPGARFDFDSGLDELV